MQRGVDIVVMTEEDEELDKEEFVEESVDEGVFGEFSGDNVRGGGRNVEGS